MEKRKKEIEQFSVEIFERMKAQKHISPFLKLLHDKNIELKYHSMGYLKSIAVRSMQIGNYRRAMMILLCMDHILSDVESVESEIKQKVSLYILGE